MLGGVPKTVQAGDGVLPESVEPLQGLCHQDSLWRQKHYTDDQVSGSTWQHWPPGHFEAVHRCDPCSWVFQTPQCDSEGQFGGVPGVYPLSSQEYWGAVQCKNKGKEEGDNYLSGKALEVLLLPLQLLLLGISSSQVWRGKCSSSSTSASTSSRPCILSKGMGSIITD